MSYPPYGQQGYPPQQPPMQYPSQQQSSYPAPYPGGYPSTTGGYPAPGGNAPYGAPAPPGPGFNVPGTTSGPGYPSYPQQQPPQAGGYGAPQQPSYPPYGGAGAQPPGQNYGGSSYGGYPPYQQQPQQGAGGYGPGPGQTPYSGYPSTQPMNQPYGAGAPSGPGGGYPGGGYPNFGTGSGYTSQGSYPQMSNMNITPMYHGGPMFQGTCRPAPNFNPNSDAEALKKAMRGFGCDDKAVLNVLCYRSNAQRQQIRQMFKTMYGKDLIQDLISELKGNFEDLIIALLYTPEEFDARELDHAMRGAGTTESTLIEIMATRTNAEIQGVKNAFRMLYHRDLEQALSSETSGNFRRLLVSLSVGGKDESTMTDRGKAAAQAKQLYEAGEKQWGTNESVFNAIMVATNPAQLQLVFEEYQRLTGHDVEQAVHNEFSGDVLDGLLAVVKIAKNRPAFFAERAYLAMKGLGTNDRALIRVIVSRCEKDMVQIKQEYQRIYNTSLENAISGDTSGKYKEGLLALIRG